ncbi:MAG: outer membrane lipoprotein carrier protein LolA [Gammaproteobacteria bacterium]|nr:outer membrane lipoprotein carrier protein LolA [Gammaproteobacteria bacterium]
MRVASLHLLSIIFILLPGMSPVWAQAEADKIQEITNQLRSHVVLSGEFKQTRKLQGFSRSIESTGIFTYWQGRGLYWETQQPFFQASTFIQDGVIDWRKSDGLVRTLIDDNPVLKNISSIIVPLVGGDLAKLDSTFDSGWVFDDVGWSLMLDPDSFMVKKAIGGIVLSGGQFIRTLVISTPGNDTTEITFLNMTSADSPNRQQCDYFQVLDSDTCGDIPEAVGLTQPN